MLGFAYPAALLALAALPAILWLLRHLPPAPRRLFYPPAAMLEDVEASRREARRPPLWLMLLRLVIALAVILAAAGPRWEREEPVVGATGDGTRRTVLLVVDNDFTTAESWHRRVEGLVRLVKSWPPGTRIHLLATAPAPGRPLAVDAPWGRPVAPADVRAALAALSPQPFPPAYSALSGLLARAMRGGALSDVGDVLWLSNGFAWPGRSAFSAALARLAPVRELRLGQPLGPFLLRSVIRGREGYLLDVVRPPAQPAARITAQLERADGLVVEAEDIAFDAGVREARALLRPPALLGRTAAAVRLVVPGGESAGHVVHLDAGTRWRRIGIIAGARESARPFAAPSYYLSRALAQTGALVVGPPERVLAASPDVVILANNPVLDDGLLARLQRFVREGGLLVRFAGPRYGNRHDLLHPVALAPGVRVVGGDLSWERPQRFAPAEADSPLYGVAVGDDVTVSGQVLALPGALDGVAVWSRLGDGTPVITARREGEGMLVFVHTSADASWSNLALSPAFPRFLDALLAAGASGATGGRGGRGQGGRRLLKPQLVIAGDGRLVPPPPQIEPIAASDLTTTPLSALAPAGFYAAPSGPGRLRPLRGIAGGIAADFSFSPAPGAFSDLDRLAGSRRELWPGLLVLALALMAVDALASVLRTPSLIAASRRRRGAQASRLGLILMPVAFIMAGQSTARAGEQLPDPARVIAAISAPRLAYITSGDPARDARVAAGLSGLTRVVRLRTAAELGEPMGVKLGGDLPLELFPLVYWAPRPGRGPLTARERNALADLIAAGGILFIDRAGPGAEPVDLKPILGDASFLPRLAALDEHHILAHSFYLLNWFPGRRDGDVVWVSADSLGENPTVSPVVIGAHDWVGAWALGADGRFLVPELPGGVQQREFAFRFGVNLVIYALAGTYKGDQIHLPAILERLGRWRSGP